MGRYFNQWGQCRAPNCTANLRRNSHEIYCNAHNLNDIRWGSPTQRRISQRELHNPLAKVRRLRKDRPDVEWGLMSANWEALVENCKSISNSRDADLRHRRRAAWVMCQVAEGITPDEAVDIVAACYLLEQHDRHGHHRRFETDTAFKVCTLQALRRAAKAARVCNVGGRDNRAHFSYQRLSKTSRDAACDLIWSHMAVIGGFISKAIEVREQRAQAQRDKLMSALTSLAA